ncbi:MAG TPA: phytanoyl-CoA dioxygenase family protein [Candidatus Binataceae bacterium]|nr:phytanoyl-CoA dioxygenase family protein [Candidatus Binataceae bacterium]
MAARIPVVPANADIAEIAGALERDGCVVVDRILGTDWCKQLKSELDPHVERAATAIPSMNKHLAETGAQDFYPGNTKRIPGLVAKSRAYQSFVMHPAVLGVCDALLKPNCIRYQVHATSALVIGPGAEIQVLHREEDSFRNYAQPRPTLVVASMAAVSDFTEANGATRVVPGSHRWPLLRKAREEEVAAAEMKAGSIFFWMGTTLHGAGANRTNEWRFGTFLSFSLGWLRQEENLYLDVPPAVARDLPKELRRLLGYGMNGALGYAEVSV